MHSLGAPRRSLPLPIALPTTLLTPASSPTPQHNTMQALQQRLRHCSSTISSSSSRPASRQHQRGAPLSLSTSSRRATTTSSATSIITRAQQQQQQNGGGGAGVATASQQEDLGDKEDMSRAYNEQMQKQMGWNNPFEYHFDRGLYMHEIVPGLFCGTQPRNPQEVEDLSVNHGVSVIMNLQQDKDIQHWGIDFGANEHKCQQLGVTLLRKPAQDFDPHSLRKMLPSAAKALQAALSNGHRVYVHCTAGLGRAPAVCIAWLYWYGPHLSLDDAYRHLTDIRPCGPNRNAIRGATYDILDDRHFDQFFDLPEDAWAFMNEQDKARLQQRLAEHWPQ